MNTAIQKNVEKIDQLEFERASNDDEISLLDILLFLKQAWKNILATTVSGLIFAGIFLLIVPNQYEAMANIQMARITIPVDKNPLGVNIEEPQALINRMSVPTSIDSAILGACGLQASPNLNVQLAKVIKLSIPKGVANVVELKVTRSSPELASTCAQSIFDLIAKTQTQMIGPMADAAKAKNVQRLSKLEARLAQDKTLLAKVEQPKNAVSPFYFALLSEIRTLEDERESLAQVIDSNNMQAAQLQAPIYTPSQPVFPKKAMSLAAGLLGGLFFGLLLALGKKMIASLKAQMQGVA